jgi:hypothetical protein
MATEEFTPAPQIVRFDSKGKIMDFNDLTEYTLSVKDRKKTNKILVNLMEYAENQPTKVHKHFLNAEVALYLAHKVLFKRVGVKNEKGYFPNFIESYKGGSGKTYGYPDLEFVSSIFRASYNDGTGMRIGPHFVFSIITAPGKKEGPGLIAPAGDPLKKADIRVDEEVACLHMLEMERYLSFAIGWGGELQRKEYYKAKGV